MSDDKRTTITIEAEVFDRMTQYRRRLKKGFNATVNELLRTGLDAHQAQNLKSTKATKLYKHKALKIGCPRFDNLDNIAEILAAAESEDFS